MKLRYTLIIFCALVLLASCKKDKKTVDIKNPTKQAAINNYAAIAYATYSDALTGAQALQSAINDFVDNPSDVKFKACQDAWFACRIPYEQSEAFRFYDGPIDNATDGPEPLMNSWPLDENYIDYVVSDVNDPTTVTSVGIINDPTNYPVISIAVLDSLNTLDGEADVTTGYHAIEFLLWGQDLYANGNGERAYTDYVVGSTGNAKSNNANQARRGQYLKATAQLLVNNLQQVVDQWAPGSSSNYRATFTGGDVDASLTKIILGAGSFSKGELAGERMQVALDTKLQEQEHSCFSDNTDNDIIYGAKSIQNLLTGKYVRTSGEVVQGVSVLDVLALYNAEESSDLRTSISTSVELAQQIPYPFDQQILAGSAGGPKIQATINSLQDQADKMVQAAKDMGLGTIAVQ